MANLKQGSTVDGKAILSVADVPVTPSGDSLLYKGYKVYTTYDKPPAGDVDAVSASEGGTYKALVGFDKGLKIGSGQKAIDFSNGLVLNNPTTGLDLVGTGASKTFLVKATHGAKTNFELSLSASSADMTLNGVLNANKVMINGAEAYHTKNSTIDNNGFLRASGTKQSVAVGDFGIGTIGNSPSLSTEYDAKTRIENGFYRIAGGATGFPSWKSSGDSMLSIGWGGSHFTNMLFSTENRISILSNRNNTYSSWAELLTDQNTTRDKSGFVRLDGTKDAVTTDQITSSLASTSTAQVASANLVSKKRNLTDNDFSGSMTNTGSAWNNGIDFHRNETTIKTHYRLMNMSVDGGTFTLLGYNADATATTPTFKLGFPEKAGTISTLDDIKTSLKPIEDWGVTEMGVPSIPKGTKLNSYFTSGYRYNGQSSDATITNNYPIANSGVYFKIAPSFDSKAKHAIDVYHALNSNRHFARTALSDGAFVGNGWTEFLTTEQHLTTSIANSVANASDEKIPSEKAIKRELNNKTNIEDTVQYRGNLGDLDLNSLNKESDCGVWTNSMTANATLERNYPENGLYAGHLEVFRSAGITQVYTLYNLNQRSFKRNNYPLGSDKWTPWTEVLDSTDIVGVLGGSGVKIPSQKLVTDEFKKVNDNLNNVIDTTVVDLQKKIDTKLTAGTLVQVEGTSTVNVMSQKGVTDGLNKRITGGSVVQVGGTSTVNVPSQKFVSDEIQKLQVKQVDLDTAIKKKWDTQATTGTGNIVRVSVTDALSTRINTAQAKADGALEKTQNLKDLANITTARTNLGLGTSAIRNISSAEGTSTAIVASQALVNTVKTQLNTELGKKRDLSNSTFNINQVGPFLKLDLPGSDSVSLFLDKSNFDRGLNHTRGNGAQSYWNTLPNKSGTLALTSDIPANQQIGVGQSWQNVTGSRSIGTTYSNNTGKPIQLLVTLGTSVQHTIYVNDMAIGHRAGSGSTDAISVIVPNGGWYRITGRNQDGYISWYELR